MLQPVGSLLQTAYVVEDVVAAARYWTEVRGVGPFFLFEHFALDNQTYRGAPTNVDLTIAASSSGGVCIEIIQQNNDIPSVYREFLDAGRSGVHHTGYMPRDYDAEIKRYTAAGHEVAFAGDLESGARVAYMDTVAALGHFTEFFEDTEGMRALFALTEDTARDWDGSDPLRRL